MKTIVTSSFYTFQKDIRQKNDPFNTMSGLKSQGTDTAGGCFGRRGAGSAAVFTGQDNDQRFAGEETYASAQQTKQMRTMLKELLKPAEKSREHTGTSGQGNVFDELTGVSGQDEEKEELKKVSRYNYKEVANKIRQAKTSLSAAQAVIAARRKVAEVKRRISRGDGDPEELQLDLTHAKRMEMAARKKRHHLELEELIKHTKEGDERRDEAEKASEDMKQTMAEMSEEEIAAKEDAVFEERQEMLDEALENFGEDVSGHAEETLAQINSMIAGFGEDLLEELEEQMEQLESMEVIDPHMSDEDFEDLKRKHRASENKAMIKADMDYLKGIIKLGLPAPSIDVAL